jgi:hypothetical protein
VGKIYFPMTCNILTPGHIKCLEVLTRKGEVVIGLLTAKALKGYKKELQTFEDRKFILETVGKALGGITVLPQTSLDPTKNIQETKCTALASGDGFEIEEELAATALNIELINLKLEGEADKTYSSSNVLNGTLSNPSRY